MHEQHVVFEAPSNLDIPIWRYMDLAKFVSMLQSNALYFTRSDVLEDIFEGSVSAATLEKRRQVIIDHPANLDVDVQTSSF